MIAGMKCTYEGKQYEPGEVVTQVGVKMRAGQDGRWNAENQVSRKGEPLAAICDYAGQPYSEGSIICQAGKRMRCTNNAVWSIRASTAESRA
jgi:hypothetical protein